MHLLVKQLDVVLQLLVLPLEIVLLLVLIGDGVLQLLAVELAVLKLVVHLIVLAVHGFPVHLHLAPFLPQLVILGSQFVQLLLLALDLVFLLVDHSLEMGLA